ncbi:Os10g0499050 [Oryza sativa Japonica Group]|uniref:Os10g0499050 protein n=1 Tax=Oryza sativa subsp. japonica TaxID=39947 RepID=A0A0P0XVV0_ORYSJ|nr:hypothetical protein EE612_052129 [Oryza sativa]BAT11511.1 Os10g0499050 [Oryza sativa Japonica Group]
MSESLCLELDAMPNSSSSRSEMLFLLCASCFAGLSSDASRIGLSIGCSLCCCCDMLRHSATVLPANARLQGSGTRSPHPSAWRNRNLFLSRDYRRAASAQ